MATFASELALRGLHGHLHVEIGGIGRKHGATAAGYRYAYRFCTEHPTALGYAAADVDPYQDCLQPVTSTIEESIDLRAVTTSLGALEFTLLDLPPRAPVGGAAVHGWGTYLISDLLGIRTPGTTWAIAEDLDAVETNILVDSTAGLTVGDALWLDAETMIVTQINAGPASIDVVRGCYNSEAQSHWQSPRGEGILYDRPQFWRGRDVRLYLSLVSAVSGALLPYTEAQLVWRGVVEDWECSGADGLAITFLARSAIGRIDRCIGRKQYSGVVRWGGREVEAVQAAMVAQDRMNLAIELPDTGGLPLPPDYPEDTGVRYFHARLGDQIVQVAALWTGTLGDHPFTAVQAQAYGLLGTPIQGPGEQDDRQLFREVLLTDPDALGSVNAHRFVDPTGLPFCHPIAISLALITSTGAIVSGGATNTDYDVLPEQWGAGVAAALIDLDSFEDRLGRTSSIRMPWLALGWEGKPIPLRSYLEQILGPFGWFLYQNESGLLALGDIAEAYPGETWPTIDEDDLVALVDENGNATGYDIHLQGSLGDAVGQQVWAYDFDFVTDQPRRVIRYEHVQTQGRGIADDSDLTYEIRGLAPDPSAESVIRAMAMARARWFVSPLPRVTCSILLDSFSITVTKGIRLTCSAIPNPFTGGRGMTDQPAIVTSRQVNLSSDPGGGTIRLELLLLPELNVGLWSPSGEIIGYDAGPPVVLTLSSNRFTSPDGGPDAVPDSDAEAFTAGAAGVGDRVMLVDFDGQVLCDNSPRVTAIGVDSLTLDGAFTLLGAPVVPAAAWPWDHVVFAHWSGGGTPNVAYTTTMAYHAAQADDATGLLPDGTSDPYVYGGT